MAFKDHFSSHATDYAAYRPTYPATLVEFLGKTAPSRSLALDCGCGSGQLSVLLGDVFERVVAIDASEQQVSSGRPHPKVEYRVAPAESSGLREGSVDLVVAAQAAHWFDLPRFDAEVRRVAKPGGLVALTSYATLRADDDVEPLVASFYADTLGPHWPPERRLVESGYATFDFPYEPVAAPPFEIVAEWPLAALTGYIHTWSAVRSLEKAEGPGPFAAFVERMSAVWGAPDRIRRFVFPLALRLGRVVP